MPRVLSPSAVSIIGSYGFGNLRRDLSRAAIQAVTLNRIQTPSEDPMLAQRLQYLDVAKNRAEQISKNYDTANGRLDELSYTLGLAEGNDGSIIETLNGIRDLMRRNLSLTDAGDVSLRKQELRGLASQLVSVLNTRAGDDGRYLFGGTEQDEKPFALDLSADPLTITYQGNNDLSSMAISDELQEAITMVGSALVGSTSELLEDNNGQLPADGSGSILQAIAAYDALLSNTAVESTLAAGKPPEDGIYEKAPFTSDNGKLTFSFTVLGSSPRDVSVDVDVSDVSNRDELVGAMQSALSSSNLGEALGDGITPSVALENGSLALSFVTPAGSQVPGLTLNSIEANYTLDTGAPVNSDFTETLGFNKEQNATDTLFSDLKDSIQATFAGGQEQVVSIASSIGLRQNELESLKTLADRRALNYDTEYLRLGKLTEAEALANQQYYSTVYQRVLQVASNVGKFSLFDFIN